MKAIPSDDRSFVLYRFFDEHGDLLYIGRTAGIGRRANTHRTYKDWWRSVAKIEVQHFDDRSAVVEAERLAILAERPRFNVHHGRQTMAPVEIKGRVYSERHSRRLRRGL